MLPAQIIEYSAEEIQFLNSYKQVDADSVAEYFVSPSSQIFSFYHLPGSNDVTFIWTGHHWTKSTKHTTVQNGLRRDLILIAEGEGVKVAHIVTTPYYISNSPVKAHKLQMKVGSQNDIHGGLLKTVLSSPTPKELTKFEESQ